MVVADGIVGLPGQTVPWSGHTQWKPPAAWIAAAMVSTSIRAPVLSTVDLHGNLDNTSAFWCLAPGR
jgi:hypothetical protein